ncbi:MAG TPA: GntR family transcriptional regulator [Acidimicrobiales bacterium]
MASTGPFDLTDLIDAIDLVLDLDSSVPPFRQVREQIADAIRRGDLRPDVRLPPVRQLAGDLGLAANTVARSYRELELAGLLETRGRHGTFVAATPSPARKLAAREARSFMRRLRELGIGDEEMVAIIGREVGGVEVRAASRRKPGS